MFEDADIENAVSAAINANFYSTGQICSNGTRVFVHEAIKEAFVARLAERTAKAVLGDPLDEATNIGPLVSKQQLDKVLHYMQIGQDEGARLVCGGGSASVASFPDGYFVQPTVFADVKDDMRIAREEIFGPVLSVLDFTDEDDVIARANDTDFGLAAGVFHKGHSAGAPGDRSVAGRHLLDQHLQSDPDRNAFRRLQEVGYRPRERPCRDRVL